MNKEDLKNKLTEEEYRVTQEKETEAPFMGKYVHEKSGGMYNCKVCGAQLFSSGRKFDSGTGWPFFDDAIPGATKTIEDISNGMVRTEVVCATCGAHLGHVFDDGPRESTGKRFCINSCALDLNKKE